MLKILSYVLRKRTPGATGEMKKLGHNVSGSYVRDVLKKHGLPPAPHRKGLSWKRFIDSHMDVTWATDFFTEEAWTSKGLVTFYVLFFIHLGTRRVYVSGATPNPNAEWVKQQARNFCVVIDEHPNEARYLTGRTPSQQRASTSGVGQ